MGSILSREDSYPADRRARANTYRGQFGNGPEPYAGHMRDWVAEQGRLREMQHGVRIWAPGETPDPPIIPRNLAWDPLGHRIWHARQAALRNEGEAAQHETTTTAPADTRPAPPWGIPAGHTAGPAPPWGMPGQDNVPAPPWTNQGGPVGRSSRSQGGERSSRQASRPPWERANGPAGRESDLHRAPSSGRQGRNHATRRGSMLPRRRSMSRGRSSLRPDSIPPWEKLNMQGGHRSSHRGSG